jgi:hypothetical protein
MQVYLTAEQALATAEQVLAALMRYEPGVTGVSETMIFLGANTDDSRSEWIDNLITGCEGEWRNKIRGIRWLFICPYTFATSLCHFCSTHLTHPNKLYT